jgi:hypothetical protein
LRRVAENRREELWDHIVRLDAAGKLNGLAANSVFRFIADTVRDDPITLYFIAGTPASYPEIKKPKLQVIVCTEGLVYDILFGENVSRYDVSPTQNVYRVEERRETEPSVEGAPRERVTVTAEFRSYRGAALTLTIVEYGEAGRELSEFARGLRQSAFER